MSVAIDYVPVDLLDQVWEWCSKAHLEKVVSRAPGYDIGSMYAAIASGKLSLWLVRIEDEPVASFTTCIVEYPCLAEMECVHLGGSRLREWQQQAVETLSEVAKACGCSALITMGRKGTEKLYKKSGFEFESVRMRKQL